MSWTRHLLALLASAAAALSIYAATITAGQPSGPADGLREVPIHFRPGPGQAVSGLQFEVTFKPSDLDIKNIVPGPIADQGDKMVSSNKVGTGRYRVIIAGFNQNILPEGTVAILRIKQNAPGLNLSLENPILSDPKGQAVQGTAAGIQLSASGTPAPAPTARTGCACAPEHGANFSGDALLVFAMFGCLLASWRARQRRA